MSLSAFTVFFWIFKESKNELHLTVLKELARYKWNRSL